MCRLHGADPTGPSLDEELRQFFKQLRLKQKPLEPEFAKVLYDNLWDLYERD